MTLSSKPLGVIGLLAVAALATLCLSWYRENQKPSRMDTLYKRASTVPNGSADAEAAVRELAELDGDRVTELLLRIALGETDFSNERIAAEAINALSERRDVEVADTLAALLLPETSIITRLAVANALHSLGCSARCIRRIIQYFGRLYAGELNMEDETLRAYESSGMSVAAIQQVAVPIRGSQASLYASLEQLLKRSPSLSVDELDRSFGLSPPAPSEFAVHLAGRLRLLPACSPLQDSVASLHDTDDSTMSEAVRNAISSIGCPARDDGGSP